MSVYQTYDLNELLTNNVYPGRGIVVGLTEDGSNAAIAYFIMGRSSNSRNRVFVEGDSEEVTIYPYDPSLVEDPSLIIYSPIRKFGNRLIVTNGDQTDTVYDGLKAGLSFSEALRARCFEPDAPNWTPRISALLSFGGNSFDYEMSILKSADAAGTACCRHTYTYPALPGVGHFLHTYGGDGKPLPTFCGEPERVVIPSDIDTFANGIWNSLNADNRISLYVRFVRLSDGATSNRLFNKNGDRA